MGMRAQLRQVSPAELKRLQSNPKKVRKLIEGKVRMNSARAKAALERAQEIANKARASGILNEPAEQERVRGEILKELASAGIMLGAPTDRIPAGSNNGALNLEKSWHVLHYLLTGKAEEAPPPLGNAILGGEEIGEDLGYGPARFLIPQQVCEVAAALSAISKEDLQRRFNLEAMMAANIYPCKDESELGLAQEYFEQLSRYYSESAASGSAMLLWIA